MLQPNKDLTIPTVADLRRVEAMAWLARRRAWEARLRALALRSDPAPARPARRAAPTPAPLAQAC
jgi:hypothetical protein